jgi:hypothetical protein
MEVLGLRVPGRSLSHLMIDIPDEAFQGFAAATGLSPKHLRAMTLLDHGRLVAGEPDATASNAWRLRWARAPQVKHVHSNFCPQCLVLQSYIVT